MSEYVTVWVDDLPDLKRGEEIVRCRDCKHYDDYLGSCLRTDHNFAAKDNDYCSWGEEAMSEYIVDCSGSIADRLCAWVEMVENRIMAMSATDEMRRTRGKER